MFQNGFVNRLFLLFRLILLVVISALALGSFASVAHAAPPASPPEQVITATPYQTKLLSWFIQRDLLGMPTSEIETDFRIAESQPSTANDFSGAVHIVANTTLYFSGPEEAGYETWPDLIVDGTNYTDTVRSTIEQQAPGIWETYEFGKEPRTVTITEEITVPSSAALAEVAAALEAASTTSGDILMGFTLDGPDWDYTIHQRVAFCDPKCVIIPEICVLGVCTPEASLGPFVILDFRAGFALNWDIGVRLPATVSLTAPSEMILGERYTLETSLTPANWSSAQYEAVGVEGNGGNEFVFEVSFFLGVEVEIVGQDPCDLLSIPCNINLAIDESQSFTTPFGVGASFPTGMLSFDIPVFNEDLLGLARAEAGLAVTGVLGSNNIQADWDVGPGASSGVVTYTQPGEVEFIQEVEACSVGGASIDVELSDFKYFFNQFQILLKGYAEFEIYPIDFGVCPVCITYDGLNERWETPPIITLDISDIVAGTNTHFTDHVQCDFPGLSCTEVDNTIALTIPVIDSTAPTTSIAVNGTLGNNNWYVSDVTVGLSAADGPPGCGFGVDFIEYRINGGDWTPYTGTINLTEDGIYSIEYRSVDLAGNVEASKSQEIKIDTTPPVIVGAPTEEPNEHGWYNTPVTVVFTATDNLSGVATVSDPVTINTEGINQSVVGMATDNAGNQAQVTVDGINIDMTPPTLTILSPEAGQYENTVTLLVLWEANDALSGVNTEIGLIGDVEVANGEELVLFLLPAGFYTLQVEVVDFADNVTTGTVEFEVIVTLEGLLATVEYFCDNGLITQHGVCNALTVKVHNAIRAMNRCQLHVAENMLNAFLNQLRAQRGQHVTEEGYEILYIDTIYVLEHLEATCQRLPLSNAFPIDPIPAINLEGVAAIAADTISRQNYVDAPGEVSGTVPVDTGGK